MGDAVKEFNIRCKDGSDSTAEGFAMIGMNADDMAQRFAAGGDTAQEAFFQTVQALDSIADPVAKNQAAIDLFGTQFEDLQANLLPMLANMEDASGVAYDALGQINEVKYDDIGSAVEGLKRTIGNATLDIRSNLSAGLADSIGGFVNVLKNADGDTGKIFDGLVEAGRKALDAVAPVLQNWITKGKEMLEKIVTGIQQNLPLIKEKAKDILQMLIDGVVSRANTIVEVGLPILQSLIQGISENASALLEAGEALLNGIITAIQQALPNLLPIAVQLITTLINGLSEGLVALMEYVPQIILAIVNVIVENLPTLITAAIEILNALVGGLMDNVSTILAAVIYILLTLVDMVIQNLPMLLDAAIQIIMAVVNGIVDNLPMLIEAAIDMIMALADGLIAMLPQLIEAGIKLVVALIGGLIKAIPDLIKAIPQIIDAIWDAITEVDWLELGGNILKGIANGLIEGVSAIWDTVQDVAGQIWDGFKDFFGINSPSKLMRDTVGKFLLPGVAVGMEDTTGDTADDLNRSLDAMMDKVDTDRLQMQLDSAVQMQGYSSMGTAGTAVQYNPPEKTAAEEYRQPQQNGDIIIPVNIGGTQLETVVVKAAQIANARSGGETI